MSLLLKNVFRRAANTISNGGGRYATDNFVLGSPQLADDENTDHDSRMFFDKSKPAFRVGLVSGDEWDEANVGEKSFAMGQNVKASGVCSCAMGYMASATADYCLAIGGGIDPIFSDNHPVTASAYGAIAIGADTIASGEISVAIGIAEATEYHALAVGPGAYATASSSTALGDSAHCSGVEGYALGGTVSADYGVTIGYAAEATAEYSRAEGYNAKATHFGEVAESTRYLAGSSAGGSPQKSTFFLSVRTTDNTTTELVIGEVSAPEHLTVPAETLWVFSGLIAATQNGGSSGNVYDSAGYKVEGVVKRDGSGNTTLVGTPSVTVLGEDQSAWNASIAVDDTNEALQINVTGEIDKYIDWLCVLTVTQIQTETA